MNPTPDSPYADDRREARMISAGREAMERIRRQNRPLIIEAARSRPIHTVLLARQRARRIEARQAALDALLDWNLETRR